MKDYNIIAQKLSKLGKFSEISQCGGPTRYHPVNLELTLCEAYVIGYTLYVSYDSGGWDIDYTLDPAIRIRAHMMHIRNIKTDREMYEKVHEILNEIRRKCGV